MSSPLEQRYRRILRLLPVGYRQAWEQDMVTSFLQSVEDTRSQRLTLGERLSVVGLALRLRLNGSHATPRWALWYHVAYGMGLLVLLYQAVAATATAGSTVAFIATSDITGGPWYAPALLLQFVGLLWVPAFVCLVLRRAVAARILATTAALAVIGTTIALILDFAPLPFPFDPGNLSRLGWLLVSTAAAFVVPRGAKASPWLWFGAYLIGSAVFFWFRLRSMWPVSGPWSWVRTRQPDHVVQPCPHRRSRGRVRPRAGRAAVADRARSGGRWARRRPVGPLVRPDRSAVQRPGPAESVHHGRPHPGRDGPGGARGRPARLAPRHRPGPRSLTAHRGPASHPRRRSGGSGHEHLRA